MMRRNRLKTLERMAEHAKAEAARALAARLQRLRAEEQRLAQINAYLGDYQRPPAAGQATGVAGLQSQANFLARLREAVKAQHGVVAAERQTSDRMAAHWRDARAHHLAMAQLGERQARQAATAAARREQRELDEIAARRKPGPG